MIVSTSDMRGFHQRAHLVKVAKLELTSEQEGAASRQRSSKDGQDNERALWNATALTHRSGRMDHLRALVHKVRALVDRG